MELAETYAEIHANEEIWKKKKKISKEIKNPASISSQKASPGSQM